MAMLGAIECIRTGSTGTAEVAEAIERYAEVHSSQRPPLVSCRVQRRRRDRPRIQARRAGHRVSPMERREQARERGNRLFEKWHGHDDRARPLHDRRHPGGDQLARLAAPGA